MDGFVWKRLKREEWARYTSASSASGGHMENMYI